ncbi:MAG: sugar ABC transporter substrate-binding protein [Candidatus Kaistia colombiensis]|nr:MAG: sugar ABC transporter substrate-binding protein [Kaistia sp.]
MTITRRALALLALGTAFMVPSLSQAAEKTIAFMRGGPDPYYQFGMNAAQAAADKLGVKLITYSANNDPTQELANVQDAITKGVDGILIYAVSLSSEKAAIAQAKKAGVPIFFQYGYDPSILADSAGIMQINLYTFGEPVGEAIGKLLPEGEYATVTGKLGRGDAEAFVQSFKNGIAKSGSKAVGVADLAADWDRQKAMDAASQIIAGHPDVKAIYAANDDMAVGVAIAIERAGKTGQILVGGNNGAPYGVDLIEKGQMTLTGSNPPSIASVHALRLLLGVIDGSVKPGQFYEAPSQLITKDNLGDAVPWDAKPEMVTEWLNQPLPQGSAPPVPPAN